MSSEATSRGVAVVLDRFFALAPREQLEAYRAVRDYLGEGVRQTKRDRVVAEKDAALAAIMAVAEHLALPKGVAPTPAQFDDAARSLGLTCARGLNWDRSRVRRAWGRWRFAKAAALGQRLPESAKQRDERRKRGGRFASREGHLTSVKLWVETSPGDLTKRSYERWAREYNDALTATAVPIFVSAGTISDALGKTWADIVRMAQGEITAEEARPVRRNRILNFSHGPHRLISRSDIERILGVSKRAATRTAARLDFPAPVIIYPDTRLWLHGDIEAYRDGRRWTPGENAAQRDSLRPLYLSFDEVCAMTGLSRDVVRNGTKTLPPPVVRTGRRVLWLRAGVEDSPAANARSDVG